MKRKIVFIFAVAAVCFLVKCAGAVDLYLDVTKARFRKIVIAVPDFEGESGLGKEAAEIIAGDLKFSGYFKTIDNRVFLEEALSDGRGSFEALSHLGAELLLKGKVDVSNGLRFECRLYDVKKRKEIFGKAYKGERKLLRKMAHRVSNDIVERVTGEKGIAGTRIAFVSNSSGHKEICVMDYDGYNPVKVTLESSLATVPSWLPDGNRIAYTTYREGNPDLYVKNVDTGEVVKLCTFHGLNYGAAWSPSGKWYALSLTRDGDTEIYIIRSDGKKEKRLTASPRPDCSPCWSPDGHKIVFTSGRMGGPHIYVMDSRGKVLKKLTGSGYNDSPDWALAGDKIVYSSRQGNEFDIWIMNSDGSEKRRLTENCGNNENPSFSPDGRHIVFSSTRDGDKNIYVMDAGGSNQKCLTFVKGDSEYPCWSPK